MLLSLILDNSINGVDQNVKLFIRNLLSLGQFVDFGGKVFLRLV
jgi:hypothetical protein